ncbi:hypothetical protein AXH43_04825 [Salmonella enterica]|nr:hypothetical protein [Salmonella enterica]EBJ7961885.1 hypothetical protein [Salmonella enterica]ECU9586217.1 hypothetical protein [Salmonella enterica subsp. enterica serovar Gaminara]MIU73134.1 hypothetical protein [Salmonella enterica]
MKKINYPMAIYILLSCLTLITTIGTFLIYFINGNKNIPILSMLCGITLALWLAITIIFLPLFKNYKLFLKK